MRIIDKVKRILDRCPSIGGGNPIVVAVSGGLDSMCLLDLIHKWSARERRLVVVHFNHGLRGEESDTDEAFVWEVARRLDADFLADRAHVREISERTGDSIEMAARDARHAFFVSVAKNVGAGSVLLAHHANDQIETFFIRVLRGGGSGALGGMALEGPSPADPSVSIIRPLLALSRAELEAYAVENGIEFREDVTNTSTEFLRNRVRHSLLPLLASEFGPGFLKTVPRIAESLRDDEAFISAQAERWMREPWTEFDALHTALARRVLAIRLRVMGVEPEFDLLERLLNSQRGVAVSGPGGLSLSLSSAGELAKVETPDCISAEPPSREILLRESLSQRIDRLQLDVLPYPSRNGVRLDSLAASEHLLDADKTGLRLLLRGWRPGDRMQPFGMSGLKKLKDIFIDGKVPVAERRRRLVLVDAGDQICWLEGFRIADWAQVDEGTRRVLRIRTMGRDRSD